MLALYASARRAGCSPLAAAFPCAAWMVAGAFFSLPPFLGFFSPSCLGTMGPSPLACFSCFSCFLSSFSPLPFLSSAMGGPLLVDLRAAALREADALAVVEELGPDPGGLLRVGIEERQVGEVDAAVLLDDPAFGRGGVAAALEVPLPHHQLLHHRALLLVVDVEHLAGLALLPAGEDEDRVSLLDPGGALHHSTSGAREMIFMNFFARSSRATGPKMRVPIGSPSLLTITALLLSNLM